MGQKIAKLRRSMLYYATKQRVKLLLEEGRNIDYGHNGYPLLFYAIYFKSYRTCKYLLKNGANVNFETSKHLMPIHIAIHFNVPRILKLLIEYGANIDGQGENCSEVRESPLVIAMELGLPLIVKILIENGVDYYNLLIDYVKLNKREFVEVLLENCANVNLPKGAIQDGNTLLHVALKHNVSKEIVEILIRFGAQLNIKDLDGNSPIETALRHEKIGMLKICLLKLD